MLQRVFSNIPRGEVINYLFQRNVTRTLPVSNKYFLNKVQHAQNHYQNFLTYNQLENNTQKYYEFGAGWDLIAQIAISLLGFQVTCIDIRKLIFNNLILDSLEKFNKNALNISFSFEKLNIGPHEKPLDFLKRQFNFSYIAPLDAKSTGFESDSIDLAASTTTMEHIPAADIYGILKETYRMLKPGGILSMKIDYRDHWSYFDSSISFYNFLQYSEKEWKKYNPSLHYQNRLRHKDYLEIINKTGFEIVEDVPDYPNEKDVQNLKAIHLDKKYDSYSFDELAIKGTCIVLRKK